MKKRKKQNNEQPPVDMPGELPEIDELSEEELEALTAPQASATEAALQQEPSSPLSIEALSSGEPAPDPEPLSLAMDASVDPLADSIADPSFDLSADLSLDPSLDGSMDELLAELLAQDTNVLSANGDAALLVEAAQPDQPLPAAEPLLLSAAPEPEPELVVPAVEAQPIAAEAAPVEALPEPVLELAPDPIAAATSEPIAEPIGEPDFEPDLELALEAVLQAAPVVEEPQTILQPFDLADETPAFSLEADAVAADPSTLFAPEEETPAEPKFETLEMAGQLHAAAPVEEIVAEPLPPQPTIEAVVSSIDQALRTAPQVAAAGEAPAAQPHHKQFSQLDDYVVFSLSGTDYAVPVRDVAEIGRVPGITRVPNVPEFIRGITNLRGEVVPVLSLPTLLGLQETLLTARGRVLFLQPRQQASSTGLLVDEVKGIQRIQSQQLEQVTGLVDDKVTSVLRGVHGRGDRLLNVLDLDQLFHLQEFQQLDSR